jgi:hypothetical protein
MMATTEDIPDSLLEHYQTLDASGQAAFLERLDMFPGLKAQEDAEAQRAVATRSLDGAAATLRQWANDIRNSPAATTANVVNQFQQLKDRQAIFYERFADLLVADGKAAPVVAGN